MNKYYSLIVLGLSFGSIPVSGISTLDLTGATGSGTLNQAFFIRTDLQPTGTGVIDPFLRIQRHPANAGTEHGYNSSSTALMVDVKPGLWTHDIQFSDLTLVSNPAGQTGDYYEFLLDINQTSAKPRLSLDKFQLYTRPTPIDPADTLSALTSSSTLRYTMDAGVNGDSEVLLNYELNSGSGSGDLFVYVPAGAFTGTNPNDFVYLYSMFGQKGGLYKANDGFEEWATVTRTSPPPPSVPDVGSTSALFALGMIALETARRRMRQPK